MKYERIIQYIKDDIKKGKYKSGDRLPSIRKLSKECCVNKSTIIRAYSELEEKHIIYSIPKSGYYVIDKSGYIADKKSILDFSQITPDVKLLPFREFNHCINKAVDKYKSELFEYGDTQGLFSLRKTLREYFVTQDIYTEQNSICLTNGAHQGLSILCSMDFPTKKNKILIEQPTYTEMHNILKLNRCDYITVERSRQGLDMKGVERAFKENDIKFFYTMSRFHNPLGTHISINQKKQLVELAFKYNVYIVEDDYLAELENKGKNLPLYYYDVNDKVIYLRSFSKSFMPGIRLGCVVLNEELKETFLKVKRCNDLSTSVLMQGALEICITSGMYNMHLKKIKRLYNDKNNILREQIKNLDKEFKYINPVDKGFIFWIDLFKHVDSTILTNNLLKRGIKVSDGKNYTFNNSAINGIRLSISQLTHQQIRHGIRTIYDYIRK